MTCPHPEVWGPDFAALQQGPWQIGPVVEGLDFAAFQQDLWQIGLQGLPLAGQEALAKVAASEYLQIKHFTSLLTNYSGTSI